MKRYLSLILAVLMLFSFTACKKQASENTSDRYIVTESEIILGEETVIPEGTASDNTADASDKQNSGNGSTASSSEAAVTDSSVGKTDNKVYNIDWDSIGRFELPAQALEAALSQKYTKPKNVILLIGDGMGLMDILHAEKYGKNLFECGVVINELPNRGYAITNNIEDSLTDSAAAATALATGVKTINGAVGLDKDGKVLTNVSETARSCGKKVGIITSDSVTGATPSGFAVHTPSRGNTAEIVDGFIEFAPDILIGDGYSAFSGIFKANTDPRVQQIAMASGFNNFEAKIKENPGKPFFGFIDFDLKTNYFSLANCVDLALKQLENDNGFFLMVESAGPDKGGHANDIVMKQTGVISLDKAVAVALKYCAQHPDTVLIVTSDHETGGVMPCSDDTLTNAVFTTTGHTTTHVGVFAIGYGTECFNDATVDNTDIAKFIINAVKG